MLAPGGAGMIASPYRVMAGHFPAAVESLGLTCRAEPRDATTEDGRPRSRLYWPGDRLRVAWPAPRVPATQYRPIIAARSLL